jgi:hypothetical protein
MWSNKDGYGQVCGRLRQPYAMLNFDFYKMELTKGTHLSTLMPYLCMAKDDRMPYLLTRRVPFFCKMSPLASIISIIQWCPLHDHCHKLTRWIDPTAKLPISQSAYPHTRIMCQRLSPKDVDDTERKDNIVRQSYNNLQRNEKMSKYCMIQRTVANKMQISSTC